MNFVAQAEGLETANVPKFMKISQQRFKELIKAYGITQKRIKREGKFIRVYPVAFASDYGGTPLRLYTSEDEIEITYDRIDL